MQQYSPLGDQRLYKLLIEGTVIPAHPLALNAARQLDEARQRQLTRYYMASGAGGIAIAVHTTQFEIRNKGIDLLEPVLQLAADEINKAKLDRPFLKVAGICGPSAQAIAEAKLAANYGYHLGLLSNGGLFTETEAELLDRARAIAEIIPVFGFYLQPAVGGRLLSYEFWKEFAMIPGVQAIKVAAFNRYQTLDVVRAVVDAGRADDIALYTGNDDNIIADLLTPYRFNTGNGQVEKRFVGGLLGHWAAWTSKAVELLQEVKACQASDGKGLENLLAKGIDTTDINAVFFDAKNAFHGCIPGIHEILRRQGLLEGRYCLNPKEELSPGQLEEIDRIYTSYPGFNDDEFVRKFLA